MTRRNIIKTIAAWLLALTVVTLEFTACHDESNDYYTTAVIRLVESDSVQIERVQGTVRATHLGSKQVFSTSNFNGAETTMEVFRGPFSVLIEGTMAYRDRNGRRKVAHFRASTDFCELMDHPSVVELKPLFL